MPLIADAGTAAKARPLLLCLSHLRWDSVVQRPHHLMRLAARDHLVVFWEEPVMADTPGPDLPRLLTRVLPDGILVATPVLPPGLNAAASEARQRKLLGSMLDELDKPVDILWFYTPMMLPLVTGVRPSVTVFDCMDELSAFRGASPHLQLLEHRLLRQSDVVFTGGRSLFAAKQPLHPFVHLFPSSVDAGHFGKARRGGAQGGGTEPADQSGVPRPRIGFHGVIDERMDLDLLAAVADRRPDWQLMMVGPIVKIDPASVPRRPNIHWLGSKPYDALPSYLAGWDAGWMPFALNEATRFISPTKTPEFLAAGVPVVSTAVSDVVRDWGQDGLVEIADTAEETVRALERVMTRPAGAWLAQVDKRLQWMSWTASWARMLQLIGTAKQSAGSGEQHHA